MCLNMAMIISIISFSKSVLSVANASNMAWTKPLYEKIVRQFCLLFYVRICTVVITSSIVSWSFQKTLILLSKLRSISSKKGFNVLCILLAMMRISLKTKLCADDERAFKSVSGEKLMIFTRVSVGSCLPKKTKHYSTLPIKSSGALTVNFKMI